MKPQAPPRVDDVVTLPDGTRCRIFVLCGCGEDPCRGGQHVGSGVIAVDMSRDYCPTLRMVSGERSAFKTRRALLTCVHWAEVPMALEAASWRAVCPACEERDKGA